jgi:hypothetical protein
MESSGDIVARIKQLEESLVWRTLGDGGKRLVSTQSGRVVSSVRPSPGVLYQVFSWRYEKENPEYVFETLESAMQFAKFAAIKEILEDDLRKARIQ